MAMRSRVEPEARQAGRLRAGMTLIELMVVVGLLAVLVALAVPNIREWAGDQRTKQAARSLSDALLVARTEAIRTGNNFIVFFGDPATTDPAGTLVTYNGQWVPVLVIDDGAPTASNCVIDAGERFLGITQLPQLRENRAAGAPTDGFRRRVHTTTVLLRNIESRIST